MMDILDLEKVKKEAQNQRKLMYSKGELMWLTNIMEWKKRDAMASCFSNQIYQLGM